MPTLIVKKSVSHRIKEGHLWIYTSDVKKIRGAPQDGDIVTIQDDRTRFLGLGIINQKSQIICRLLTRCREEIDDKFFRKRIESAWAHRQRVVQNTNAFRVIYSEGDFLPGLIVDNYENSLVVQFLTLGMEQRKQQILQSLNTVIRPRSIYQRNDVKSREYEGLSQETGWLTDATDSTVQIMELGVSYRVDFAHGQKTGFYLDQRENRNLLQRYILPAARVLDGFCYTGGFSIAAAKVGASEVIGIDFSEDAIRLANENSQLNNVQKICTFKTGNIFDELKLMTTEHQQFDCIILDPPAFTKSRTAIAAAYRGYKEINLRAMKLLKPGGILVTCSCSQHISFDLFGKILQDAAKDAGTSFRILERRSQAQDHPILIGMPETEYLKCWFLQLF